MTVQATECWDLTHYMCTKFDICSFCHSRDINHHTSPSALVMWCKRHLRNSNGTTPNKSTKGR